MHRIVCTFNNNEAVYYLRHAKLCCDAALCSKQVLYVHALYRLYTTEASAASLSADLLLGMHAGEVMFGTDSHTCNAGAFGQFASGIGNTDAGFILGTGKLLIKVPPSIRFVLDGEMPPYLLAKDIILQIIGEITVAGNCYHAWLQPAHMQS